MTTKKKSGVVAINEIHGFVVKINKQIRLHWFQTNPAMPYHYYLKKKKRKENPTISLLSFSKKRKRKRRKRQKP